MSTKIDAYQAGVSALRDAVKGMSREQLIAKPIAGRWSTLEVVCHLVDSEVAWTHRMKRVIAEDKPLLIGYDETRLAELLGYQDRDLDDELELFDRLRTQMTKILRSLSAEAWGRQGIHNERGLVSLDEMLQIETEHVTHHLNHIEAKRKALGL